MVGWAVARLPEVHFCPSIVQKRFTVGCGGHRSQLAVTVHPNRSCRDAVLNEEITHGSCSAARKNAIMVARSGAVGMSRYANRPLHRPGVHGHKTSQHYLGRVGKLAAV